MCGQNKYVTSFIAASSADQVPKHGTDTHTHTQSHTLYLIYITTYIILVAWDTCTSLPQEHLSVLFQYVHHSLQQTHYHHHHHHQTQNSGEAEII